MRRGSQAVEFALVLPVIVALFAGIIDLGWYFSVDVALRAAVRDGLRTGSRALQSAGPPMVARDAVITSWAAGRMAGVGSPRVVARLEGAAPMQLLHVRASMDYVPLIGLVPLPASHSADFRMRMVEQPPVQIDR